MNLANEQAAGFFVPIEVALEAVLSRLDTLSRQPEFALQRELALARFLRPYLENGAGALLPVLPQETELANLTLFCDFYPEDGQLTLIEQLRDVITEHIPDEERAWLDPLKHSHIDLLEVVTPVTPEAPITLHSLGDGTNIVLPYQDFAKDLTRGQVLLTRVIADPKRADSGHAVWAGCGLVLSASEGRALYGKIRDWERQMEMSSGELVLGEWQEFTKRFGYVLLWTFAEMRVAALIDAVTHIQYRTPDGEPYLYAIALYDHHEYRFFCDGLSGMKEWQEEPPVREAPEGKAKSAVKPKRWVQSAESSNETGIVARLTLTSSQLIVECDHRDRLNDIKHLLARNFGFSLHFRSETLSPPYHRVTLEELQSNQPVTVVVSHDEDRTLLRAFLEKAYLEWSDQPHQLLKGQTPRHAAASPASRENVAGLIAEMEATDPGLRRGGRPAYDYNVLRGHVGLDETA